MRHKLILLSIAAALLLSATVQAQQKTIVETAIAAGNFNTLVAAVKAAGLVDTLNGHSQFTVFAPTDDAFSRLDPKTIEGLLQPANKDALTRVLTYHVLAGRILARDAYDLTSASTVNGQLLPVDFRGDSLKIGESTITVTDIECSNGVIHVIDTVLLPKMDSIPATAAAVGQFNTLLAAVDAAGLAEVLSGPGPFTVFAPTDDAFAALPAGTVESLLEPGNKQQLIDILRYHVVPGRVYASDAVKAGSAPTLLGRNIDVNLSAMGLLINDASVVIKNVDASNGVVHVIDKVLIPGSMSRKNVMSSLLEAINKGSAVYNAGHHSQCCDVYMETLESINSAGVEGADNHSMTVITQTLKDARDTHSMTDRAWVLRRGIDALYIRVSKMPDFMPTSDPTVR